MLERGAFVPGRMLCLLGWAPWRMGWRGRAPHVQRRWRVRAPLPCPLVRSFCVVVFVLFSWLATVALTAHCALGSESVKKSFMCHSAQLNYVTCYGPHCKFMYDTQDRVWRI